MKTGSVLVRLAALSALVAWAGGCCQCCRRAPSRGRTFTYAQWNIGHFAMGKSSRTTVTPAASAERAAEYRAFLKELDADVIGISEFEDAFDTAKTPSRTAIFADYPHLVAGPANGYQWNALMTRAWAFVTNRVHNYRERKQGTYWLDTECAIDGKTVHFVQSHLDWDTNGACVSHRRRQIAELIAAFRDLPYVVISADFNVSYETEWEPLEKAGFELAVCGRFGPKSTCGIRDPARTSGIDNVVVKGFAIEDVETLDDDLRLSDHRVVKTRLRMLPEPPPEPPLPATHAETPVAGAEPSLLPEGTWRLAWHDEFDGTKLDDSKWGYRTYFWGRRAHWFATPEDKAVEVKDGTCRLKVVKRPDGQFVSPQLQTGELVWDRVGCNPDKKSFWPFPKRSEARFLHRYGYYECRAKLQKMPGWWSAFWMQAPANGATLDPAASGIEQDIMESFMPGEVITHAFHMNGYGGDYVGFNSHHQVTRSHMQNPPHVLKPDAFHRFGLLWEEDGYTVFVDGKACGMKVGHRANEAVSMTPEFILITTECKSYRNNGCTGKASPDLEAAAAAGDQFEVDYVRVFDRVPES